MKYPDGGPSGGTLPPISILAPAVVARSIIARMRRRDFSELTGPSCVSGSAGLHTRLDAAARSAHAGFARGDIGCKVCAVDRTVHIHVVKDNDGAFAAEFERSRREIASSRLTDRAADIGAAGEDNFSDYRMRGKRRPRHSTYTIDEIDDALGYPGAIQQLNQPNGRERRLFGGLDDDAVAGCQRRSKTLRKDHQRVIERSHQRHHAERHPLRIAQVWPFDRDHVAAACKSERSEVSIELRKARDLRPRLHDRAPIVERLKLEEIFQI